MYLFNLEIQAKSLCISYRLSQDVRFPRYGAKTFESPRIWIMPDSAREECQHDVVTPVATLFNTYLSPIDYHHYYHTWCSQFLLNFQNYKKEILSKAVQMNFS